MGASGYQWSVIVLPDPGQYQYNCACCQRLNLNSAVLLLPRPLVGPHRANVLADSLRSMSTGAHYVKRATLTSKKNWWRA
jgi:hypothetical protein